MRERPRRQDAAPSARHAPARKRFGQHFLEAAWVRKLIAAIDPKPDEAFIEIGPGRGALTRPLAERARHVTAYEIDRDLAADLRACAVPNLTLVEGDFLDQPPAAGDRPLRVAANLPYNVASPILFKLLDWSRRGVPLVDATVMLQREVADRLLAEPGSRDYGVLTVLVRHRASVERLLSLPPGAFRPPPKVQSAVVRLRFHAPDPAVRDEAAFERLVKKAFSQRRKMLANALFGDGVGTESTPSRRFDIGRRRAETLSIADYADLANRFG
ncbi:MAG TPA: 16S rRNA (adenine(1518)-N(6)/adenine(1519)-N(6))-dimethyltransferase RsmA [Vicinamibacterales bacterium]|nr:16S rRNA (adenine(1518)-N(6)/adenine(1519)-N(6))-dimethyltransferase RsmA [Vicinamibacterales bacterium]